MAKFNNDCFKISLFNTFDKYFVKNEKFDKSPFNYLIYVNRCDNINKINSINNNLFDKEFEEEFISEYRLGLNNVNFMGQNLKYNLYYWSKKDISSHYIINGNDENILFKDYDTLGFVSNQITTSQTDGLLTKFYKYNIINEKFATTSKHTLTLEEYVRKIANFLLNIPDLKIYVLLPNLNVIEYSSNLPCSTWTESYLLIKYYNKNISRFEPIFKNILKEYYTQNLTKTIESIYKNNYYLGNNLNKVRNDIKTYYQNDDAYWNGELKIGQKPETKEIKYSSDLILLKYQKQIEEQEKLIKELRKCENSEIIELQQRYYKDLEKIKNENEEQLKAIKTKYDNDLIQKITDIKMQYSLNLETVDNEYASTIQEQNNKLRQLKEKIQGRDDELAELKIKLSKQNDIIKKLTN